MGVPVKDQMSFGTRRSTRMTDRRFERGSRDFSQHHEESIPGGVGDDDEDGGGGESSASTGVGVEELLSERSTLTSLQTDAFYNDSTNKFLYTTDDTDSLSSGQRQSRGSGDATTQRNHSSRSSSSSLPMDPPVLVVGPDMQSNSHSDASPTRRPHTSHSSPVGGHTVLVLGRSQAAMLQLKRREAGGRVDPRRRFKINSQEDAPNHHHYHPYQHPNPHPYHPQHQHSQRQHQSHLPNHFPPNADGPSSSATGLYLTDIIVNVGVRFGNWLYDATGFFRGPASDDVGVVVEDASVASCSDDQSDDHSPAVVVESRPWYQNIYQRYALCVCMCVCVCARIVGLSLSGCVPTLTSICRTKEAVTPFTGAFVATVAIAFVTGYFHPVARGGGGGHS